MDHFCVSEWNGSWFGGDLLKWYIQKIGETGKALYAVAAFFLTGALTYGFKWAKIKRCMRLVIFVWDSHLDGVMLSSITNDERSSN